MRICVVNTGGTISCVGDPLAPMGAAEFAEASKRILDPVVKGALPEVCLSYETSLTFPESSTGTLDSTNLQPSDWCLLAEWILENYEQYDAFIVLHGTDSMDYTGAALPLLLNVFDRNGFGRAVLSKPVILTGSQLPMYQQVGADLLLNFDSDAFQNFCGAVSVACLRAPEVGVYFDAELMRGSRVVKVNASGFRAFESPNYPPLATVGINVTQSPDEVLPGPVSASVSLDDPDARALAQQQLAGIRAAVDETLVMPFSAWPAPYSPSQGQAAIANLLTACLAQGVRGLVLQSYGEGNFPSGDPDEPSSGAIYQALAQATASEVLLVDSTQVLAGVVNDTAYASGSWLAQVGALGSYDMTAIASTVKATLVLAAQAGNAWSFADVQRLMQTNLAGEMLSVDRVDSRIDGGQLRPGAVITSLDGSATLENSPEAGPQLLDSTGTVLWSPGEGPGRLTMQDDGNLVLYSSGNVPLWASNTGVPTGASSVLWLSGSADAGTLALRVYDYCHGQTLCTLYEQTSHKRKAAMPQFKFSGRVPPGDIRHSTKEEGPDGQLIPPTWVSTSWGNVAQYAPTVQTKSTGYDPAGDCNGYFMSCAYQPNNNCYAYGCNIATNSFPQPGRASGAPSLSTDFTADHVVSNAVSDGLIYIGATLADVHAHAATAAAGHYVALMFSEPESAIGGDPNANWPGDYHWARCDDLANSKWSQKDGGDQVTNFDFAGQPITDPSTANWRVNQGPISSTDSSEYQVTYDFVCFMFVPYTSNVGII